MWEKYDEWKLDYPEAWDKEDFVCDDCGKKYHIDELNNLGMKDLCNICYAREIENEHD